MLSLLTYSPRRRVGAHFLWAYGEEKAKGKLLRMYIHITKGPDMEYPNLAAQSTRFTAIREEYHHRKIAS